MKYMNRNYFIKDNVNFNNELVRQERVHYTWYSVFSICVRHIWYTIHNVPLLQTIATYIWFIHSRFILTKHVSYVYSVVHESVAIIFHALVTIWQKTFYIRFNHQGKIIFQWIFKTICC